MGTNLADLMATKKKPLPGDPANPDAMNNGVDGTGLGTPPPLADAPGLRQPEGPKPAQQIGDYTGPAATTNGGMNLGDPLAAPPQATTNAMASPHDPHAPVPLHDGTPQPAQQIGAAADPFASIGGGVQLPTGEWVPNGHPLAQGQPQTPSGQPPPGAPPGVTGDPRPPSQTAPQPAETPAAATQSSVYRDALLKQLGDAGTPATIADPALKAQSDAYALGQQRSTEQARSAMAERMSQEGTAGTSSGAFDQGLVGLYGQQGENMAGYNAGLVGDANKSKLQQMQSTLAMMGNDVNSEAGRTLQKQIADMQGQIQRDQLTQQGSQFDKSLTEQQRQSGIDAELKRLGITSQTALGQSELALRAKQGDVQAMLQLAQMRQQNDQFGQGLSSQNAQYTAGLNQQSLMQMLGML